MALTPKRWAARCPPCLMALLLACLPAHAAERNRAAVQAFKWEHPCPATGDPRGPCPGWIIDHIKPLACGGADDPANMQWQTREDAKAKDRWERRGCAERIGYRAYAPRPPRYREGYRAYAPGAGRYYYAPRREWYFYTPRPRLRLHPPWLPGGHF